MKIAFKNMTQRVFSNLQTKKIWERKASFNLCSSNPFLRKIKEIRWKPPMFNTRPTTGVQISGLLCGLSNNGQLHSVEFTTRGQTPTALLELYRTGRGRQSDRLTKSSPLTAPRSIQQGKVHFREQSLASVVSASKGKHFRLIDSCVGGTSLNVKEKQQQQDHQLSFVAWVGQLFFSFIWDSIRRQECHVGDGIWRSWTIFCNICSLENHIFY